jgi:hypothetical protein
MKSNEMDEAEQKEQKGDITDYGRPGRHNE